jgi:hypothetical protein
MKALFAVTLFASLAVFANEAEVAQEAQNPVKKVLQQGEIEAEAEVAQEEVSIEEQS